MSLQEVFNGFVNKKSGKMGLTSFIKLMNKFDNSL